MGVGVGLLVCRLNDQVVECSLACLQMDRISNVITETLFHSGSKTYFLFLFHVRFIAMIVAYLSTMILPTRDLYLSIPISGYRQCINVLLGNLDVPFIVGDMLGRSFGGVTLAFGLRV